MYLMLHEGVGIARLILLASVPAVQFIQEGALPAAIVAVMLPIFWLAINGHISVLRSRILVRLGAVSYSLYVLHHMIGFKIIDVTENLGAGGVGFLLIAVLICLLLAFTVTYLVERPSQRHIRSRWKAHKQLVATKENAA